MDFFNKHDLSSHTRPFNERDFNSRIPRYNDDSDYTTNAPSYYDDLARKNALLKTLSLRIWEYQEVINKQFNEWDDELKKRFLAWDKNLEEFDDEVLRLLQEWLQDGTLDHIINDTIFNWKADKEDLVELDNRLTSDLNRFKNDINININSLNDRYDDHINNYNAFRGEIINIREYDDLNGDGQLFDTAIIQHAVDNYKVVLIPESDSYYKIDKQINVPSDTHIIGLGLPKIYNDISTAEPVFNVVNAENVKFERLDIQNGLATLSDPVRNKDGFYFYNSKNILIKECFIHEIAGLYGMSFEKCSNIRIIDNHSYKISRGHCLLWGEVEDIIVEGNTFDTVTNTSVGAGSNYTYLLATAHHSNDGEPDFLVRNLTVRHNTFKNNPTWEGIDCHGGVNVVFEHNHIENVHTGIMLSYHAGNFEKNPKHENITIRHNNIRKGNGTAGGFGIVTGGGYVAGEYVRAKNIEVTHNKIYGMGRPGSLEDGSITVNNVEHFNISDNLIENYEGVGISTKSDSSYGSIMNNTINAPAEFGLRAISLRFYGMFIQVKGNKITGKYGHSLHGAGIRFSTPGLYDIKDNIYMFTAQHYELVSRSQLDKNSIELLNSTLSHESVPAYDSNGVIKFRSTDEYIRGLNGSPDVNTTVTGEFDTKTLRLSGSGNLFHFFEGMEIVIPGGSADGSDLITHIRLRTNDTLTVQDSLERSVIDVIPYLVPGNWVEV